LLLLLAMATYPRALLMSELSCATTSNCTKSVINSIITDVT